MEDFEALELEIDTMCELATTVKMNKKHRDLALLLELLQRYTNELFFNKEMTDKARTTVQGIIRNIASHYEINL